MKKMKKSAIALDINYEIVWLWKGQCEDKLGH